jgi:23S rRNA (adenine2503-C2)-methyltransferase
MKLQNIAGFTRKEIGEVVSALDEKPYHRDHVFRWIYRYGVTSFAAMTDLSKGLREKLERDYVVALPRSIQVCRGGQGTARFVLELEDGYAVESVLLPGERHDTLCLSTQAADSVSRGAPA